MKNISTLQTSIIIIYSRIRCTTNLSSTGFYLAGSTNLHFLDDDGAGNVRSYYLEQGTSTRVYTNSQQGSINYTTGQIIVGTVKCYFNCIR
nr:MAG: hypothetical protein CM15mV30_1720 [uncultured marine virus]